MKKVIIICATFGVSALIGLLVPETSRGQAKGAEKELSQRRVRVPNSLEQNLRTSLSSVDELATLEEKLRRVIALASSIPLEDLETAHFSGLAKMLDEPLRGVFQSIISERWLEYEPEKMVNWSFLMKKEDTGFYLAKWALLDQEKLEDYMSELSSELGNEGRRGLLKGLLELDPTKALEMAAQHYEPEFDPFGGFHEDWLGLALARHDLELFLEAREAWSDKVQEATSSSVTAVLLEEDFVAGLAYLKSEKLGPDGLLGAVALTGSPEIFREVLEHWSDLPEGWSEALVRKGPWALSPTSMLDLLEVDAESYGIEKDVIDQFASRIHPTMLQQMTEADREQLLGILNGSEFDQGVRQNLLEAQIRYWPEWDEDGLQSWLGRVGDEPLLKSVSHSVELREEHKRPLKVISPGKQMAEIAAGEGYGDFSTGHWSDSELSEAVQVFSKMPDKEKEVLMHRLNENSLRSNMPVEFGAALLKHALESGQLGGSSEQLVNDQLNEFVSRWVQDEPAEAAAWAGSLSGGSESIFAQLRVASIWNRYAPDEARAWAETLPPHIRAGVLKVLD